MPSTPTMNLRELRDTRQLKAWLRAGKTVELRERDRVIGHIVPDISAPQPNEWPDFSARMKKMFGDEVFENAVLSAREQSRY